MKSGFRSQTLHGQCTEISVRVAQELGPLLHDRIERARLSLRYQEPAKLFGCSHYNILKRKWLIGAGIHE